MSKPPVVTDNGTGFVKAGYAGNNYPSVIFPSIIGRPIRMRDEFKDVVLKDVMVGDECAALNHVLETSSPVQYGLVTDWEEMGHVWDYTFYERMKITPSDHKIMLTAPPTIPSSNKKRMCEVMFDKYNFEAAKVSIHAALVLYAQGLLTGVVLDSGDGSSHVAVVWEGICPPLMIRRLNVGGRHVTRYLIKLLQIRGYALSRLADFETARQIKEKLCYVGYDLEVENRLALDTTTLLANFELPDGRVIKLDRERYEAPEVLFTPHLIDDQVAGFSHMLFERMQEADIDTPNAFYKHIVLSGGSTLFPGVASRLEKDIREMYLTKVLKGDEQSLSRFKLSIEDPPCRKYLVFRGASVLANVMKDREEFWISKAEWNEQGARILEKK